MLHLSQTHRAFSTQRPSSRYIQPTCAARWVCHASTSSERPSKADAALLRTAASTAAAAALALALSLGTAAPAAAAVNSAVLKDLQRYRFQQADQMVESKGAMAVQHLQGSLQQLDKVVMLAQLNNYDAARLQLREGSFKTLRLDLGYGAEMYRIISPSSVRDAINQIELLDRALKARADVEEIRQLTDTLGAGIRRTADLLQTAEAEAR